MAFANTSKCKKDQESIVVEPRKSVSVWHYASLMLLPFKKRVVKIKIINIKWYKIEKSPDIWENIYYVLWSNVWIALHSGFADKTLQSSIYSIFISAECRICCSQTERIHKTLYLRVQNYVNTITGTLLIKINEHLQRARYCVSHAASVTVTYVQ